MVHFCGFLFVKRSYGKLPLNAIQLILTTIEPTHCCLINLKQLDRLTNVAILAYALQVGPSEKFPSLRRKLLLGERGARPHAVRSRD